MTPMGPAFVSNMSISLANVMNHTDISTTSANTPADRDYYTQDSSGETSGYVALTNAPKHLGSLIWTVAFQLSISEHYFCVSHLLPQHDSLAHAGFIAAAHLAIHSLALCVGRDM